MHPTLSSTNVVIRAMVRRAKIERGREAEVSLTNSFNFIRTKLDSRSKFLALWVWFVLSVFVYICRRDSLRYWHDDTTDVKNIRMTRPVWSYYIMVIPCWNFLPCVQVTYETILMMPFSWQHNADGSIPDESSTRLTSMKRHKTFFLAEFLARFFLFFFFFFC